MALTLTSDHGYLVLSTASMCFFGAAAGGLYVGATRSKVFGKEWSEGKASEALREEHKKEPDMGNGRFAATLSYKEWLNFNNAQRAHYNLVENFPSALGLHVLSGLFFPKITAASSLVWIFARHVWASNYITSGANARYGGIAGLHVVCLLGWLGASVYGGWAMAKLPALLKL